MKALLMPLIVLSVLTGCTTTTLYTGNFSAEDSKGTVQPFVLYWNASDSFIGSIKASPVALLSCHSKTILFEEQPAPTTMGTQTWIVFRGDPGNDQPVLSLPQLGEGICGRILTKNNLSELADPKIELTISCEAGQGDDFTTPTPYLKAKIEPYTIDIRAQPTKNLPRDTPSRPVCN